MQKGRPDKLLRAMRKNNNIDKDLDAHTDSFEDLLMYDEDDTEEAGEGDEMLFYNDDEDE